MILLLNSNNVSFVLQGMQALRISWPIGAHFSTRAATSGAYDELAVDDDDEAATILAAFAANQKV